MSLLRLLLAFFLLLPVVGLAQGRPVQTLDGVFVNVTVVEIARPKSDIRSVSPGRDNYRLLVRDNQGKVR